MKDLLKSLRLLKKQLTVYAVDVMPEDDAYSIPYCICMDTVDAIDECIKQLPPEMKLANKEFKIAQAELKKNKTDK